MSLSPTAVWSKYLYGSSVAFKTYLYSLNRLLSQTTQLNENFGPFIGLSSLYLKKKFENLFTF